MNRLRRDCLLLVLLLAAFSPPARPASAAEPSWGRKLTYVKALAARAHFDLAEFELRELEADQTISADERPALYRDLAGCWAHLAARSLKERDPTQRFARYLNKSTNLNQSYLKLPSVKASPTFASESFRVRLELPRLALLLAEGHAGLSHQPNLPVADKEEHQRKALSTYEAAIGELENAVRDQDERRGTLKGQRPREKSGLQNWADKYLEALNGLLRAHLCLNQARASLAKFLQSTGAPEEKWKPIATEAEKGYKQTLREFVGHRAAREGAVPLAEVVAMLGKDQEALERLHEVWVERGLFRGARAIPCEAQSLGASILLRLGRHREALNGLHEMVAYATRQEAPSGREAASANSIALLLLDMDEPDDPNQVGREALGRAFLLIAQVYGALGDRAKKDGKPTEEIRALFAQAHETALGVRLAGVRLDTPCSEQMDRWRREAAPPGSLRR